MLHIPQVDGYFNIFTDEEVKDSVAIKFSEYFKSAKEEQNLRKVARLLYIFLTTPDEVKKYVQSNSFDNCIHCYNVEILNIFDPELKLINSKPMIKSKLKELLSELKKFNIQKILVLDYKKKNNCKIFHSSAKVIAGDSEIDEAFKSMHQSIMKKIKNYACKNWIDLDVIIEHSIKIFECQYKNNKKHKKI